jgi:tetratricopeptide (TPR) repeat protein
MLQRALVVCLLGLFAPHIVLAQDPPDYTAAVQLVQEERWAPALQAIQNLLQRYPGNPKVINLQGLALLGSGDRAKAAAAFERVLKMRPTFFPAMKNLAILDWQAKNPRAAERTYQALAIQPQDHHLNAYAALADLQKKNTSAAQQHIHLGGEAISSMPPELEMQLAYLLGTRGLYGEAVHVYQDLVANNGRIPKLTYNLALAQYLSGNYEDAIHSLQNEGSQERTLDQLTLLAQSYEMNHQTQLAIDTLREAITLFPADENSYLDLANVCIDHNAYPLGIEIVELGLKNRPRSERLRFELGVLHALSGQFDRAREEFRVAEKMAPGKDLPIAAMELADIQQNGQQETIQELRRNLQQKGDSAILCYLLGSSLIRAGAHSGTSEYAEARAEFRKAIRLDPRLPYPYIELGKMYEESGDLTQAITLFEKAAGLSSRDPAPYYHLARDYQKLHQPQKAHQMLEKFKQMKQRSREFEEVGLTTPEGS